MAQYPSRERAYQTAYRRKWRAQNPDANLSFVLKTKYGITLEDFRALEHMQCGVCAICGQSCARRKRLSVDHDHTTGRVRGLLCVDCNLAIGRMKDDPDLLRRAADYLTQQ